jgi:hypothetical protein
MTSSPRHAAKVGNPEVLKFFGYRRAPAFVGLAKMMPDYAATIPLNRFYSATPCGVVESSGFDIKLAIKQEAVP